MSGTKVLKIHPNDNVAVLIRPLESGQVVEAGGITVQAREHIPAGHKIALGQIAQGDAVVKYGFVIGTATEAIAPGAWVHEHNVRTTLAGRASFTYAPDVRPLRPIDDDLTFEGYVRVGGEVGIRNELWIVPMVGCVNPIAERLARSMADEISGGSIDGVHAFPHPYGCSSLGVDHARMQHVLAGLVRHPNAGGVLVLALGCETNTLESFKKVLGEYDPGRVRFLVSQEVEDELDAGMRLLRELADYAGRVRREAVPVSRLRVGLKCGGSDAFSGLTANPLVGAFSDRLVARGGATVLTEVPEMFGAEPVLLNRCESRDIFDRCAAMINEFRDHYLREGHPISENPSPGNRAGGLTTLEDKSLGCVQKGGTSPVIDVLRYGDPLRKPGLSLLEGPGDDLVAVTALAAAGVHMVLFTTGRGTPLGGPVPTIKIATNTDLARRKKHWIDFDAGALLEGCRMNDLADELFMFSLDVASGRRQTRNEEHGYRDIAIFKGVTL